MLPLRYAIDFGTSNSLLAAASSEKIFDPAPLSKGLNSEPSILRSLMFFPNNGAAPQFGDDAISLFSEEGGEGRFIRSIKKFLPAKSFQGTQIGDETYTLESLIARFLSEMKARADKHYQQDVQSVVMGRPARFSENDDEDALAQKRLGLAAELAGFKDIHFFPEPLAAAYDYRKTLNGEKLLLIVDLGGGTSDFTVMKVHPGRHRPEDVLSIGGLSIAGDALDSSIMTHKIAPHFGSEVQYQLPMSRNILTMPSSLKYAISSPADITLMSRSDIMDFLTSVQQCVKSQADHDRLDQLFSLIANNLGFPLFHSIEDLKKQVCTTLEGQFVFDTDDIYIKETLTRTEFEDLIQSKIDSILKTMQTVLTEAQIRPEDIDSICCTGGTSKVPMVAQQLEAIFGPNKIQTFKNFHSVIQGLSQRALELYS